MGKGNARALLVGGICAVVALLAFIFAIHPPLGIFLLSILVALAGVIWLISPGLRAWLAGRRERRESASPYDLPPSPAADPYPTPDVYLVLSCINLDTSLEIRVDKPNFVVGRSEACDYTLNMSPRVSRRHLEINCDVGGGTTTVISHSKSTGTYLNNLQLTPGRSYPVSTGDVLQIADFRFDVQLAHF